MAERHTVDVDVVGSKPIRLPKKSLPFEETLFLRVCPIEGWYGFETHQAPKRKTSEVSETSEVRFYLGTIHVPDGTRRIVIVPLAEDEMRLAGLIEIHFVVIAEREPETVIEDVGEAAREG